MDSTLAIQIRNDRIKALGGEQNCFLQFRPFILDANQTIRLDGPNQFFILVADNSEITIYSDFGIYDISNPVTNEITYEHQGEIIITNFSPYRSHVQFYQIIPKNY